MKASLYSCQEEAPLMRSSSLSKQWGTEGGDLNMHWGSETYQDKYIKLIQEIVLRVPNQGARVAGGESNIFQVHSNIMFADDIVGLPCGGR